MKINILKSFIEELAGANSVQIVDILVDKENVNEFLIAKKMDLTINQVRNILYKLSAEGLVSFIRKKDKRKGWYIYFWTLSNEKCFKKIEEDYIKKIEELLKSLSRRENDRYYICKGCNIEVEEQKALEEDFSCEECTEVYELVNNTNMVRDLKGKITKKENELKEIRKYLEEEQEKVKKKREKNTKASATKNKKTISKKEAVKELKAKKKIVKKNGTDPKKKVATKKSTVSKKKIVKKAVKKSLKASKTKKK